MVRIENIREESNGGGPDKYLKIRRSTLSIMLLLGGVMATGSGWLAGQVRASASVEFRLAAVEKEVEQLKKGGCESQKCLTQMKLDIQKISNDMEWLKKRLDDK